MKKKAIYCTVTNDLNQDQRMHRICNTFIEMGMEVILVGRQKKDSKKILDFPFVQKRLYCFFENGFLFYAEYNIRLFFYLLFRKTDMVYSVDLDTIIPGYLIKKCKNIFQIYDAHEYFTEVPELKNKTIVRNFWKKTESYFIPKADLQITVSQSLSDIFTQKFKKHFHTIRNIPNSSHSSTINPLESENFIVYKGMLNEGRGLEAMILAMEFIPNYDFKIIGDGDISKKLITLAHQSKAKERIKFLGWLNPKDINDICSKATLGVNLLESDSISYYYSLANKFFDYLHLNIPSVNMDFPEYRNFITEMEVGILIKNLNPLEIASDINDLLDNPERLKHIQSNCQLASVKYNWENESIHLKKLIEAIGH